MLKHQCHPPSNVFEHPTSTGRGLEIFLAPEDFTELLVGGTVTLDEYRARFDHGEIHTGAETPERAVVRITIAAREQ